MKKILTFGLLIIMLLASSALAQDSTGMTPSRWHDEPEYIDRAFGKLMYGGWNVLLCWTEIMTEPTEALGVGENFFVGLGRGVWNAAFDFAGGFLNAVTFPITALQIPLPEGGVDAREF